MTGAIEPASWPPQPLPAGIERSDAAALAEAARRALAAGGSPPAAQWQNPETGSTGTLEPLGRASQEEGHGTCRTYLSTVTSIRGVHRYTCRACRAADGTVSVHSIAPGPFQTARSAGI